MWLFEMRCIANTSHKFWSDINDNQLTLRLCDNVVV